MHQKIFRLEIRLGNDAMSTGEHVAQALSKVAAFVTAEEGDGSSVRDQLGNSVGEWMVVSE